MHHSLLLSWVSNYFSSASNVKMFCCQKIIFWTLTHFLLKSFCCEDVDDSSSASKWASKLVRSCTTHRKPALHETVETIAQQKLNYRQVQLVMLVLLTNDFTSIYGAVVAAQLVERSLLIPEIRSLNPNTIKIYLPIVQLNRKDENKEKEAGNDPSLINDFTSICNN